MQTVVRKKILMNLAGHGPLTPHGSATEVSWNVIRNDAIQ